MAVFARHSGKGPRQAKSFINERLLVTVLEGAFTPLEETLLARDDEDLVRSVRQALALGLKEELVAAVEGATGLQVADFNSQVLLKSRLMVELFLLEAPGRG